MATFSNGTEFEIWEHSWCRTCKKDEAYRNGESEMGCPILLEGLTGTEPVEWTDDPNATDWPRVICSEYEVVDRLAEPCYNDVVITAKTFGWENLK